MTLFYSLVFFTIFLSFSIIPAFAVNPTPYNEWDFDFTSVEIIQDSRNLEDMIISMDVTYLGEMSLGTVNIIAKVTEPDGKTTKHSELLHDMKIEETRHLQIIHEMKKEGTYGINLSMMPPSEPHMGHIFDNNIKTFTVEPRGLERAIEAIVVDSGEEIYYKVEAPSSVRSFEVIHVVIDLPEIHTFEKITIENGSIEEYSIDTQEIYIKSALGFQDIQVNLVRQDNLLPNADAEDSFEYYVKFYAVVEDVCYSVDCVTIPDAPDVIEEEPAVFPIWILGLFIVGVIIPLLLKKRKTNICSTYLGVQTNYCLTNNLSQ